MEYDHALGKTRITGRVHPSGSLGLEALRLPSPTARGRRRSPRRALAACYPPAQLPSGLAACCWRVCCAFICAFHAR